MTVKGPTCIFLKRRLEVLECGWCGQSSGGTRCIGVAATLLCTMCKQFGLGTAILEPNLSLSLIHAQFLANFLSTSSIKTPIRRVRTLEIGQLRRVDAATFSLCGDIIDGLRGTVRAGVGGILVVSRGGGGGICSIAWRST